MVLSFQTYSLLLRFANKDFIRIALEFNVQIDTAYTQNIRLTPIL